MRLPVLLALVPSVLLPLAAACTSSSSDTSATGSPDGSFEPDGASPDASADGAASLPANPIDALDPATGPFAAARAAVLALAAKGTDDGIANPERLVRLPDPFFVTNAMNVVHAASLDSPAACANSPVPCRNPAAAKQLLQELASTRSASLGILIALRDALDRWAVLGGAAEALGYANLLDQAGLLKAEDKARIQTSATALSGALTNVLLENVDIRRAAPNGTVLAAFLQNVAVSVRPPAAVADAARAVVADVVKIAGATPTTDALLAPVFPADRAPPSPGSKAEQAAQSIAGLVPLLALDHTAEETAFGAYLDALGTAATKFQANTVGDADWDALANAAKTMLAPLDLRIAVISSQLDRELPQNKVALDPIDENDPNVWDYFPPNASQQKSDRWWPLNRPKLSFREVIQPKATPVELPGFVAPRPPPKVTPLTLKFSPGRHGVVTLSWPWVAWAPYDHLELHITEWTGAAAETTPSQPPKKIFRYKPLPDGRIARGTLWHMGLPATGEPVHLTVHFELMSMTQEGFATRFCTALHVSGTADDAKVEAATDYCEGDPPFTKIPHDSFDDAIPANTIVLTSNSDEPIRPRILWLDPGTTSIAVYNLSADPASLSSMYSPPWVDSGFGDVGGGPAVTSGTVAPHTTGSIALPGTATRGWTLWPGGNLKDWITVLRK